MRERDFSSTALTACVVCGFLWSLAMIGGCAYLVFWRGASEWWFALALFFAGSWGCKSYRSPEQIAAARDEKK